MSRKNWQWMVPAVVAAFAVAGWASQAGAQQHLLVDKQVKAGQLVLFQDLDNKNVYYYAPTKARLSTDENGTPVFSFIRFVRNEKSTADQAQSKAAEGGGIVSFQVTLGVTPEEIRDAERELSRIKPGARIEGPATFKSGKFGLVSVFADGKGNQSNQVLGLGNAPLLDGGKAAVSIELTQKGATQLWQAFDLPTPGIFVSFEMEIAGYSSPKRAVVEADWSKVYSHRNFAAGFASTYLSGEVNDTFEELRRTSAIKITQVGEDDKMNEILTAAYGMIKDQMFEAVGGTGQPSLADMTSFGASQPSLLDRASTKLKEARAEVAAENADIKKDNDAIRARNEKAAGAGARATGATSRAESANRAAVRAEAEAASLERRIRALTAEAATAAKAEAAVVPANQSADVKKDLPDGAQVATVTAPKPPARDFQGEIAALRKQADAAKTEATRLRSEADGLMAASDSLGAIAPNQESLKAEKEKPAFSILATLTMKKVKQSGTFKLDMNKYMPESRMVPFTESIGDLRRLKADASHFRSFNMDDPLFKQREIVAMIDGVNAQDFGQFVNFVNVQMRKKHEGGDITDDEVRVDRNNFNKEGNNFKLMYGWKDDNDRTKWLDYEVQTTWSLFGGKTVVQPWRKATGGAINLSPPYHRRTVTFDGDPEALTQKEVRAVTVQLFYDVEGAEQSKQLTLNVAKGQIADKVEILAAPNNTNYAYQLTWQLKGNKSVSTGRQSTASDIVYVDEIPAQGTATIR